MLAERERALDDALGALDEDDRVELARLHELLLAGFTTGRAAARTICRMCDPDACGHHDGRCPVTLAADRAEADPRRSAAASEPIVQAEALRHRMR